MEVIFPDNQVILYQHQMDMGPHRQAAYAALVNEDVTHASVKVQVLTDDLEKYLNQYFHGTWKLLRRVDEKQHHPGASPYKIVYYVLALDTDADAETVRSRLAKDGYKTPAQRILTSKLTPPVSRPIRIIAGKPFPQATGGGGGNGQTP
jgi:hypothetical protein